MHPKIVGSKLISVRQYTLRQFAPILLFLLYFAKIEIFVEFQNYFHINKIYRDKI